MTLFETQRMQTKIKCRHGKWLETICFDLITKKRQSVVSDRICDKLIPISFHSIRLSVSMKKYTPILDSDERLCSQTWRRKIILVPTVALLVISGIASSNILVYFDHSNKFFSAMVLLMSTPSHLATWSTSQLSSVDGIESLKVLIPSLLVFILQIVHENPSHYRSRIHMNAAIIGRSSMALFRILSRLRQELAWKQLERDKKMMNLI